MKSYVLVSNNNWWTFHLFLYLVVPDRYNLTEVPANPPTVLISHHRTIVPVAPSHIFSIAFITMERRPVVPAGVFHLAISKQVLIKPLLCSFTTFCVDTFPLI